LKPLCVPLGSVAVDHCRCDERECERGLECLNVVAFPQSK
jgi:hypothetical protein